VRFAAADIARIIAGIMENPNPYIGTALQLHGPIEYSHEELATEVGRVPGKNLAFEQVTASVFLETPGIPDATVLLQAFRSGDDRSAGRLNCRHRHDRSRNHRAAR
jgi:NAD(P)H dehydrogenase (quinone)